MAANGVVRLDAGSAQAAADRVLGVVQQLVSSGRPPEDIQAIRGAIVLRGRISLYI